MTIQRYKYPRSYHLPWSEGATSDDKTLTSVDHFVGREVVVSEKCDGENTTLYSDGYMHARSLDGRTHESQAWVRALAATMVGNLPAGWRVCGENLYARHSLGYDRLGSYFYVFAIYDQDNRCLSWDDTVEWAALLGLEVVPVRYRGLWDEAAVKGCYDGSSAFGNEGEGYVVRVTGGYHYTEFSRSLAKFVRRGHVQEGAAHWRSLAVTPNILRT